MRAKLDGVSPYRLKSGARLVVLCYPSMIQVNSAQFIDHCGYDHAMPERVAGDFFRRHSQASVMHQDVQGDARLANADGARVIDVQRQRISV